jgi:hypothetical protein
MAGSTGDQSGALRLRNADADRMRDLSHRRSRPRPRRPSSSALDTQTELPYPPDPAVVRRTTTGPAAAAMIGAAPGALMSIPA